MGPRWSTWRAHPFARFATIAEQEAASHALADGQSRVVISTTAIIIGVLIVILLIVAID